MARALSAYDRMYWGDAVQIGSFKTMMTKTGRMVVVVVVVYSVCSSFQTGHGNGGCDYGCFVGILMMKLCRDPSPDQKCDDH